MIALSLALFGFSIPNLSDQSSLLTDFSIPERGRPADRDRRRHARAAADHDRAAWCVVVAYEIYRRRDWLIGRRLVDVRADREPRLAGAVVRDLAAAAGGAGDEPVVCAGRRCS